MKRALICLALIAASSTALADVYTCNATRTSIFPEAFDVKVEPLDVLGCIFMSSGREKIPVARVSQLDSFNRNDPEFLGWLNYLKNSRLTGLSSREELEAVTVLKMFNGYVPANSEGKNPCYLPTATDPAVREKSMRVIVIQLFAGHKQIGGAFWYNSAGTICMPKR